MTKYILFLALFLCTLPSLALACACGCGIFDVGTSSMLPTRPGGTAFLEYDFMNQDRNWSGASGSDAANNSDKTLRTQFYVAGMEYMLNRSWGAEMTVPYTDRYFTTEDGGNISSFRHAALGDVRVSGIYSGFSADMSTGVTFGLKLPTGDYSYTGFDRDTEIGTGSTDTLLGAYSRGILGMGNRLNWFAQGSWDHPVLITAGYRPGDEMDEAAGVYYDVGHAGVFTNIAPIFQILGSERLHDSGGAADPQDSGYTRAYLSPGVEARFGKVKLYADVELPVYQYMSGNQLVAPALVKFIASYNF